MLAMSLPVFIIQIQTARIDFCPRNVRAMSVREMQKAARVKLKLNRFCFPYTQVIHIFSILIELTITAAHVEN